MPTNGNYLLNCMISLVPTVRLYFNMIFFSCTLLSCSFRCQWLVGGWLLGGVAGARLGACHITLGGTWRSRGSLVIYYKIRCQCNMRWIKYLAFFKKAKKKFKKICNCTPNKQFRDIVELLYFFHKVRWTSWKETYQYMMIQLTMLLTWSQ